MRDIGKNIRLLRQQKNMTQDELAEALFVTRQTVSNYETGRSRPDVEMLLRIAEVLGVDANTVLYGPPVPESRKAEYRKTARYIGLTALLGVGVLILFVSVRDVFHKYFTHSGVLILINGWLIPAWKLLAGCCAMQLLHAVAGVKRLKKPTADHIRWGILVFLVLYVILILPMSVYLVRSEIELYLLRKAGGEYSYSSFFSFVPVWDQAASIALMGTGSYLQGFWKYLVEIIRSAAPLVAGALLWLCGKEMPSAKNCNPSP